MPKPSSKLKAPKSKSVKLVYPLKVKTKRAVLNCTALFCVEAIQPLLLL